MQVFILTSAESTYKLAQVKTCWEFNNVHEKTHIHATVHGCVTYKYLSRNVFPAPPSVWFRNPTVHSEQRHSTNAVSPIKGIYWAAYDSIHKSWAWGGGMFGDPVPWRNCWGSPPLPSACCWASLPQRGALSCGGWTEQRAGTYWCQRRWNLGPQSLQQQCSSSRDKTQDWWRGFW